MRVSIAFDGSVPLPDTLDTVDAAEQSGLDGVWSAEHLGLNDAMVPSAVYATRNPRIDVGAVGPSADTRHPGLLAMELATLAALTERRVRVQVGTGSASRAARIGAAGRGRLATVEAMVDALRALLSGETVTMRAERFTLDGFSVLAPQRPPAIDVMAMGPKMTALACRIGDGVSLSTGASRAYLRASVAVITGELARLSRRRDEFRVTAMTMCFLDADLGRAGLKAARVLARLPAAGLRVIAPDTAWPEPPDLADALADPDPARLTGIFPLELVQQMFLVATPATLPRCLTGFAETGIDELAVMINGPVADHGGVVRALAAAREASEFLT